MSRRTLLASAAGVRPSFTFAAIADVQYADKDTAGKRPYRESLAKLQACVPLISAARPAFTVQLGDLVDEGRANLNRILPVFNQLPAPRHHVMGNHDPAGWISRSWYAFRVQRVRFLVLNGCDLNRETAAGAAMLDSLRRAKAPNAQDWNGGIGNEQLSWLRKELGRREPTVLFCHFPVAVEGARADHLLWNWQAVLETLDAAPNVLAWINGHYHPGASATRRGVRHITLPGLVEHTPKESVALFEVRADAIQRIA